MPAMQRALLLQALLKVSLMRLSLYCLPRRTIQRLFTQQNQPPRSIHPIPQPDQIAYAVTTVSRYIPHATCLTQALAMQALLSHNGYSSQLHIGVAKADGGRLQAHAWVEYDGRVVLGGTTERYTPLLNLTEKNGQGFTGEQ